MALYQMVQFRALVVIDLPGSKPFEKENDFDWTQTTWS